MTSNLRKMIPYGYQTYTGRTLNNSQVDSYNAVQERINSFILACRPVPEYILNASHNLMASYCYGPASIKDNS